VVRIFKAEKGTMMLPSSVNTGFRWVYHYLRGDWNEGDSHPGLLATRRRRKRRPAFWPKLA